MKRLADRPLSPKKIAALADQQIETAFRRTCSGIPISVMDIGKVYAVGRKALADGADLDTTIRAYVETIRQDKAGA